MEVGSGNLLKKKIQLDEDEVTSVSDFPKCTEEEFWELTFGVYPVWLASQSWKYKKKILLHSWNRFHIQRHFIKYLLCKCQYIFVKQKIYSDNKAKINQINLCTPTDWVTMPIIKKSFCFCFERRVYRI